MPGSPTCSLCTDPTESGGPVCSLSACARAAKLVACRASATLRNASDKQRDMAMRSTATSRAMLIEQCCALCGERKILVSYRLRWMLRTRFCPTNDKKRTCLCTSTMTPTATRASSAYSRADGCSEGKSRRISERTGWKAKAVLSRPLAVQRFQASEQLLLLIAVLGEELVHPRHVFWLVLLVKRLESIPVVLLPATKPTASAGWSGAATATLHTHMER